MTKMSADTPDSRGAQKNVSRMRPRERMLSMTCAQERAALQQIAREGKGRSRERVGVRNSR